MTTLHGLQAARARQSTRESSPEPVDAARTQDIYGAWKAIFENARPAHPGPARSRPDQQSALHESSGARPERFTSAHSQGANGESDAAGKEIATALDLEPRAVRAGTAHGQSTAARARAAVAQVGDVRVAALPRLVASAAASDATTDVAVRVHYVRQASAAPVSELRSEVISIILEGARISIIVRDAGLTAGEALRTAFQTARELTGRAASLQQLTLNGRLLYQQAGQADVAQSCDILFAC